MAVAFHRCRINTVYIKGHERSARGHQVARKDQVGGPRACFKNNVSMINVFTLTNINAKIIEGKMSKLVTLVYQTSNPSH